MFRLVFLATACTLIAQEFRSTVYGRITDPQGGVVAAAQIVATQKETGAKTETVSGADGQFTLPFLAPGSYSVVAQVSGFKQFRREGMRVGTNERIALDIALEIGQTSESVTVSAESPLITTSSASVGQVITERQISNMPMNGRTPLVLAQLAFGVIPSNDPRFYRPFDDGGPSGFSMGGAPNRSNELLLDGAPDSSVGNGMGFSPPVDAVEEVKVESFQADAAYGHTGGGTVNMVTKAGTNSFHGTAYNFNQVSATAATLFFTNRAGQKKNPAIYNQWGLTAGGPVVIPKLINGKNRLFFFFAYEGISQKLPRATSTTTPTAAQRNGDFSQLLALNASHQLYDPSSGVREGARVRRTPFAGNIIPASRISPIGKNILTYYDAPNQPGRADGRDNFFVGAVGEFNTFDAEMGRMDFNVSSKHKLFFAFRHNDRLLNNGTTFSNNATGSFLAQLNWGATLDDVYTLTPTMVLNTRLNWLRNGERRGGFFTGFDPAQLGFPASLSAQSRQLHFPEINIGGYAGLGSNRGGGIVLPYDNYQIFSSVSKTSGLHTVKFGIDTRLQRRTNVNLGQSAGSYTFGTNWTRGPLDNSPPAPLGQELASLLLGLPTDGYWDMNATESSQNLYLALFFQDDFRLRPNLTLNLGLRFEKELPTTERYNRSINGFDFSPSPIAAAATAAYARNPIPEIAPSAFRVTGGVTFATADRRSLFRTPSAAWGPRFGLAWTPAKLGSKTVLRGGAGMFYFPLNRAGTGIDQTGFSQRTPLVRTLDGELTPYATLANPFRDGIIQPVGSALGMATNLGQGVGYFSNDVKNGYSLRWNFDVQRQLPKNAVLEMGYVYNHGVGLEMNRQLNFIPGQYLSRTGVRDDATNNLLSANVANPFAGLLPGTALNGATVQRNQLLRPFPQFSGVTERTTPQGSSYFHMFQARVEKRFSHGVQLLANYLYSKLIERRSRLNDFDPLPEKRISSDDRPQRFVLSASWDLPLPKGRFFGGWTVNSIYTTQAGSPLGWGNVLYLGGDLNLNPRAIDGAFDVTRFNRVANQQLVANVRTFPSQFSTLRADGVNNIDLSVIKNTYIFEKVNLQFRCEFFNAFNHATFNPPALGPTATNFGTITSQANLARSTQMALRLVW